MALPPPDITARYVDKDGKPTIELFNWIRSIGLGLRASYAVASLPPATGLAGARTSVSDATVTTFASVVTGGGTNFVPIYSDGTNWRIG